VHTGPLNRKIVVEQFLETRNELNEQEKHWTPIATLWASYEPISDGERFRANENAATASARFVVRSTSLSRSISALDRVNFQGVVYQVVHVKEKGGRNVGLELTCKARADGQRD
jgi:SPP1 family predicted phage head-tail adaptor